jgi:glutamyl aminopeptidase
MFMLQCLQQNYISTFKFSNAEMSQLWLTFQEAAGNRINIGEVMDTWTRQMGFPVVSVSCAHGTGKCILNQTRFLVNPSDKYTEADSQFRFVFWKY